MGAAATTDCPGRCHGGLSYAGTNSSSVVLQLCLVGACVPSWSLQQSSQLLGTLR